MTKLYDGIEQLEDDLWGDDASDSHESYAENEGQIWAMNEDGTWQPDADGHEWEEYDDDMEDDDFMDTDHPGWADESMNDESSDPHFGLPGLPSMEEIQPQTDISDAPTPHGLLSQPDAERGDDKLDEGEESPYKRFDILSSAPADHAFFTSPPAQPSKSFLGRLTREYRVLASSLPGLLTNFC